MMRRGYLIVGMAVALLVVTLAAASVSTGPILGSQHTGPFTSTPGRPATVHRSISGRPSDSGMPTWFTVGMSVLLLLYVIGLLVLMILSRLARRRDEEESLHLEQDEAHPDEAWRAVLTAELGSAVDAQSQALEHGSPRNAIVACWMALQAAALAAGMPERRWETADEFVVRGMQELDLDRAAISELSQLYREARFSHHVMVEEQRELARAALRTLSSQLAQRRGVSASASRSSTPSAVGGGPT